MREHQYIGTYWTARGEPIADCARRAEHFFLLLSRCDPSLSRWYKKGWTLENALKHQVKTDASSIKEHFQKQEQPNGRVSGAGFSLRPWNGEPDDGGLGLSLLCGGASSALSNSCVLDPPEAGPLAQRLLTPLVLAQLLRAMVLAWEPEWGLATSDEFLDLMPEPAKESASVGWLTYLSHRRGPLPPLPPPVHVEPVEDLGSLLLLTPERLSVSNPAHLALARDVTGRLGRAGLLTPSRRDERT